MRFAVTAKLPKSERFYACVDQLYSGFAKLPRSAPWLNELRREMQTFPAARNDDQVDSISQFLNWAPGRAGRALVSDRMARRDGPRPR